MHKKQNKFYNKAKWMKLKKTERESILKELPAPEHLPRQIAQRVERQINQMTPRRNFFTLSRRKMMNILKEIGEYQKETGEKLNFSVLQLGVKTACSTKPVARFFFVFPQSPDTFIIIRSKQDWRVSQTPNGRSRLLARDNSEDFDNPNWPCKDIDDSTTMEKPVRAAWSYKDAERSPEG